jgi:hypothetical protein
VQTLTGGELPIPQQGAIIVPDLTEVSLANGDAVAVLCLWRCVCCIWLPVVLSTGDASATYGMMHGLPVIESISCADWERDWTDSFQRAGPRWSVVATSSLAPQGQFIYSPEMLVDGNPETAWVEGKEGHGIGEGVTFQAPDYRGYSPADDLDGPIIEDMPLWGVLIRNGYCRSRETWLANSRVSLLLLKFNDEPVCYISLQDSMEMQHIPVSTWSIGGLQVDFDFFASNGNRFTFEIKEVYPGECCDDTGISTICFITGMM